MNNEGKKDNYNYPANNLLENWEYEKIPVANAELRKQSKRMAEIVQQTLDDSRAKAKVVKKRTASRHLSHTRHLTAYSQSHYRNH